MGPPSHGCLSQGLVLVGEEAEGEAGEEAEDIYRMFQDPECGTEEMGHSGGEEALLQPEQQLPGTPRPAKVSSCWRGCGRWWKMQKAYEKNPPHQEGLITEP